MIPFSMSLKQDVGRNSGWGFLQIIDPLDWGLDGRLFTIDRSDYSLIGDLEFVAWICDLVGSDFKQTDIWSDELSLLSLSLLYLFFIRQTFGYPILQLSPFGIRIHK